MLVSWPRNQPSQVTYRDMRPYWGTNLENHLGDEDPENYCHIFFYSFRAPEEEYTEEPEYIPAGRSTFGPSMRMSSGERSSPSSSSGAWKSVPVVPADTDDDGEDNDSNDSWDSWRKWL